MVPYVIVLLVLVAASDALNGNKQYLRPQSEAPLYKVEGNGISIIKGEYVVVLKKDVSVTKHVESLGLKSDDILVQIDDILVQIDIEKAEDDASNFKPFKAFGARLDDATVSKLRSHKDVQYIEHNFAAKFEAACTHQIGAPWGIRRTVDRRLLPVNYLYECTTAGEGVDVYVIDSGIDVNHTDFGNRATWGTDLVHQATAVNSYKRDFTGHGTHVAGTIISATYGMAKRANAIAVKVLDEKGVGTLIRIIRGINYAVANDRVRRQNARKNGQNRKVAVINMSLVGPKSKSENDVVHAAVQAGLVVIVAAGNKQADACNYSPASANGVITVAASNINDAFAETFSNHGPCTHIIAPGEDILSTRVGGGYISKSGTSMAAPHVSGAVAKYLSRNELYPRGGRPTPANVKAWLIQRATTNIVANVPGQTPNKLLHYRDCV